MAFYAVRRGRKPGIYNTWNQCQEQVNRFTGAEYRKFETHKEAQDFVAATTKIPDAAIHENIEKLTSSSTPSLIDLTTENDDKTENKYTIVYSDGCCFANGKRGSRAGYGVYWSDNHPWNISERLHGDQTNQRAELAAAIRAMELAASNSITHLEIRTDSKYTIQSATEWIRGWKRSNWIKSTDSKPVMNKDLMMKIDELQEKISVKWTYVPGHSSNKGNDEADRLAKAGAKKD